MKSASGSGRQAPKWRWTLKKTLARKPEARPIEDSDVGYAYAAYKHGCLREVVPDDNLDAKAFKEQFEMAILTGVDAAWTVLAATKKGKIPVGLVLGSWHPLSSSMIVAGIAWFPWASRRNIVEGTVSFFNDVRREIQMICYAKPEHRKLYETAAKHGILRRIGTSHTMFDEVPATLFETMEIKQ